MSERPGAVSDPDELAALPGLFTAEQHQIAGAVRAMCDAELAPRVPDWFESGRLPDPRGLMRQFGELGLLGMHLTGYGCAGLSATDYGLACRELEACDSGIRSMASVQGSLAMYAIWRFGSEDQKQQWLPGMAAGEIAGCFGLTEPDHGSDPAGMRTRARRDGAGENADWVLTGSKMWITNGTIADVAVVWAQTSDSPRDIRGFLVPTGTAGFTANEIKHKLSLRASVTAELVLQDVRLPADAALPGASGLAGPLSCLTEARYGIAWGAMGSARSCLHAALDYARSRQQFGRPIGGFQLTQAKLADMLSEYVKGMLLAAHLGRLKDAGAITTEQVSLGKLNNVREALQIARTARTVLGANGISLEYPVIRHAANLESVLTYEGTVEMHTLILGQALTGQNAFR